MSHLPTGTVTFLFTDIEGSTRLLQQLGDRDYANALAEHRRLLRDVFHEGGGYEVDAHGDAFFVSFSRAKDAILSAIAAQRAVAASPWPEGAAVRVRMGLHTGEPVSAGTSYVGTDVHLAARICTCGHGGQILLSRATSHLVEHDLPQGVALRDLGEHRLKDLARGQQLYQLMVPDLPADFPPLNSLEAWPNNLPMQLTSFIGREREVAELKRLLTTARLITLTGVGGSGKTRLALQVAAEVLEDYPHGAWVAELAALTDPALVPQTIASVLSVSEQPSRGLLETLVDALRSRQLLLVLDNCEHLLSACADVADTLLRGCRQLRILATSREGLRIGGEALYPVPPLPVPVSHALPPPETLIQYGAVRLFIERGITRLPTLVLTSQNARAIAETCTRLDGIPLAIELAAARINTMAMDELAARLSDRFRLLTGGSRTALPRHQTLRATMDWSYDLLSVQEQVLLRRLSVFAGGFTLEAAEAVCADEDVEALETLDLLSRLVEKSLVLAEQLGQEMRYRLLETVRQYSRDKLLEAGESESCRDRHLDFFLALAERTEPQLRGPEQAVWLESMEMEHDNLRAALEWSLNSGVPEAGLRLAGASWWFWYVRGYYREGRGWLDQVLRRSGSALPAMRAKVLGGAGYLATNQGDYAAALSLLEESLVLWQQLGDKQGIALSLNLLGRVAWHRGDFPRAADLYKESLVLFRELGAKDSISVLLNNLGVLAINQGDFSAARSLLEESLAIRRQLGDKQGMAMTGANLGVIALRQGDYAAARSLFKESLTIDRDLGDKRGISSQLEVFGLLAAAQGHAERAARLLGVAEALREAIGAPLSISARALFDYDRYLARVRAALGREALATVWAEGRAMTLEQAIEYAMSDDA